MPDGKSSLITQILATVVGGLLLSLIGWFAGWLPTTWGWIVSATSFVWNLLTTSYSVPVWALVAVLIFAVPTVFRVIRKSLPSKPNIDHEENSSSLPTELARKPELNVEEEPELNALELAVVRIFAKGDGQWLQLHSIATSLGEKRLKVEQVIESLYSKDLLKVSHSHLYGTSYRLSPAGRDYAIKLNFV